MMGFGLHSQWFKKLTGKMNFHLKHLNFMINLAVAITLEYCDYKQDGSICKAV